MMERKRIKIDEVLSAAVAGRDAIAAGQATAASPSEMGLFAGACHSLTHPQTRHEGDCPSLTAPHPCPPPSSLQGILSIDWWETGGCIQWGSDANAVFDEWQRCQYQAEQVRQPVPCTLGDGQIFVHERGMGSGRGSRLGFRLDWCGVTIGLSDRNDADRRLSNFYLKIPGEACLIHGADRIRETVASWIAEWGGNLHDEWVKRLDICLDVPGLDLHQNVFPACQSGQYLSTMRRNSFYRDGDRITGFTIGSCPGARLTIYDKLLEVRQKGRGQYGQAMIDRRWGGFLPEAAGRVEYQLHREFFQQFSNLKTATDVMANLPDVLGRLIQTEQRPFFQLTDAVPDRKGRHQSRVGILAEWAVIIELIRSQAGQPRQSLKRLERNLIDTKRAIANIVGYGTSAAAQLGFVIESKPDLLAFIATMLERNEISDDVIRLSCEDKSRRCGTFDEVTRFPFGANQAI